MISIPDHHFNPVLAQKYGIDTAVFLHNIYFWVKRNEAYKKHFHEGRYWTYNSLVAFSEAHPYWSKRQIERIVSSCKKNRLLLTSCFNEDKRDRTTWYSLSDEAMLYFEEGTPKVAECISPNGEMQERDAGQSFHQTVPPLPDNNPGSSQTDIPPVAPQGASGDGEQKNKSIGQGAKSKTVPKYRPDWFERFWALYPRRTNRVAAVRAWDKLKPDLELCKVMTVAIRAQMQTPQWRDGPEHIPHPSTWLNGARWLDEVIIPAEPDPGGWASDPEVY